MKILNIEEKFINNNFGKTTAEYLTDPNSGLLRIFDETHYPDMLHHNLRYYFKEVGFMNDDVYFQQTIKGINSNPTAKRIWEEIVKEKNPNYHFRDGRIAYFKIVSNITVPFIYYYEPLLNNSRFRVVEWIPQNPFFNIISKFL